MMFSTYLDGHIDMIVQLWLFFSAVVKLTISSHNLAEMGWLNYTTVCVCMCVCVCLA